MKKYLIVILLSSALGWAAGGPGGNIIQFSNNGVPTNVSTGSPLPVTGTVTFYGSSITSNQGAPGPTSSPWPVTIATPLAVSFSTPVPVTVPSSIPVSQGSPGPTSSPWPVSIPTPLPITVASPIPVTITTPLPVVLATNKAPINPNGNLSSRQTVTQTESNLSAPSSAVAVIIECEDVNADNIRWGFSNSATNILSSTLGMLCEPGRSENIPIGQGSVFHMISLGSGSDYADIQWVLSQ